MQYNKIIRGFYLAIGVLVISVSVNAATFTVTNTANTGAGSLRQAVLDANAAAGADIIVFDSTFNSPQTITLATVITINGVNDTLTITGPGANLLTISGNNLVRIFTINAGEITTITGITFTAAVTGAISNSGTLTVTDSTFSANANTSGGGGITNSGVSLTVTGCTFTSNTNAAGGIGAGGAGIQNNSPATITNSTFSNNSTIGGAGGGAIHNNDVLSVTGSTFTGNATTVDGQNAFGGAISVQGGGQLTINSSVLTGNSSLRNGGAIYYQPNGGTPFLVINNSTISNNTANSDSNTTGNGGGLYLTGIGPVTISGSTINGNTSNTGSTTTGRGGGIDVSVVTTITNSTISGNTAQRDGGGIYATGVSTTIVNIDNSTIVGNTAALDCGGLYRASATNPVSFGSTIIANNTDDGTGPDVLGTINSNGFNLIENTTGGTITGSTATNITGQDPNLGALADNGGVTFTHALNTGSPAIDKGFSFTATADQRQQTRPVDDPAIANASGGDGADIGAFEIQPILQFDSATYSISEGGGTATITVNRTNGSEGVDTVQYATSDGSATGGASCGGGVDYQNASGTLTFNPSDLSQTFTVTICDDGQFKSDETINLTLSSPIGATLGTPVAAVLTILNDDTPTPTSTNTFTPTNTATNTATSTATNTATNTPTPTPTPTVAISGTVTYGNAIPAATRFVSNVLISGAGSPNVSTTTSFPGGTYSLTGFGSGSYTVTPTKTGAINGSITSFDAARISQHAASINSLTGNQLIVADVSGNSAITSFDAAQVAKYSVGPPFLPPGIGSTSTWIFIPASRNYPSVSSSIAGQDYSALLMGEVSGNWQNSAARSSHGPKRDTAVAAPQLVTQADGEVLIPISAQGAANKEIISYEFDLRYDPTVIQPQAEPVSVEASASRGLSFAFNAEEAGLLRVAVYGPMPIEENGLLLNLRFTAVGAPGSVSPLVFERFMFNEGYSETLTTDGEVELVKAAPNHAEISGRLLDAMGQGIPMTQITLIGLDGTTRSIVSNGFGYYRFGRLQVGQTYTISVETRRHAFTPLTVGITGQLVSVDMIAEN
ncbi:MAG: choice-of-anchor Q domain-containing protein [Pyrinomonadaceae bacterium]